MRQFQLGLTGCAILLKIWMIMTCAYAGKTTRPGQPLGQPRKDPDNPPRTTPPGQPSPDFFPYNIVIFLNPSDEDLPVVAAERIEKIKTEVFRNFRPPGALDGPRERQKLTQDEKPVPGKGSGLPGTAC